MQRRFRGEWRHKVDAKGRVSIPAPFRRVLERDDPDWTPGDLANLVLVFGRKSRGCLEGYSMAGIDEIDDIIAQLPKFSREREALSRMLSTHSRQIQLEETGRIVLSQTLRDQVGITNEAVFAGMTDRFQIWEPGAFDADNAQLGDWVRGEADEEDDIFALLHAAQERLAQ